MITPEDLVARLAAGDALPKFTITGERESDAWTHANQIAALYNVNIPTVLALLLVHIDEQKKCIEMQDYELRGASRSPWARAMQRMRGERTHL